MADIAALGISINTTGVTAADAALDRLTKAATDATNAVNRMSAAAAANSNQAGVVAKQALSAASAHSTLTAAVGKSTAAHGAHGAAMMNSRLAMMEYEHSIRAVVDGLAAGMSPLRLFALEGARLAQAYQMGGGASGALQMFGGIVSKLMNPTVLLTGAVVGLGAAGAYAFSAWESRLGALQQALNGLGRSTGLTLSGLNNMALGAAGGRTSTFQAQSAVAAFAATGRIQPDLMRQLIGGQQLAYGQTQGVTEQYARATGTSFTAATKSLAADFADPTKGAEALNKEFGLLSDRQLELIRNFEASGQVIKAQGVLLGALQQDLAGAVDRTWTWAKAWDAVATGASNALAAVGGAVQSVLDPTIEQRYFRARGAVADMGASQRQGWFAGSIFDTAPAGLGAATGTADDLNEQYRRSGQQAAARGRTADAAAQSIVAGNIVRQVITEITDRQGLTNQRNALQTAIVTPGALEGMGVTPNDAAEALGRLNARLANFATAAQKVTEDSNASAAATAAQTAQQRVSIQAFKAYSDVMRETGNAALAAATATAKWNEALAEAKHALDDETRSTAEAHGLIGLRPVQREQMEILNRGAAFEREHVSGAAPAPDAGAAAGSTADYIKQGALARGIDPNVALRVAQSEGLGGAYAGDQGSSFGPFQLHYGGVAGGGNAVPGLGDTFTSQTGLDARNPSTVQQQIDFALDQAKKSGWGAWHGAAGAGIGNWQGIGTGATPTPAGWPVAGTPPGQHAANISQQLSDAPTKEMAQIVMSEQDSLDAANRSLQAQMDTWGKMPGAIAESTTRAKLLNQEIAAGVPITQQVIDANQKLATQAGQQAQDAANFQQLTGLVTQVQDMASSFTSGAASDLAMSFDKNIPIQSTIAQLSPGDQMRYYTGKLSAKDARNKLAQNQIGDLARQEMFKFGLGSIERGVMGSGSTPGLLSPLFSGLVSLFKGGLGGIGGGAASGGGVGLFNGAFGDEPTFGFAGGGVMTPLGPMPLRRYASGGVTSSPQAAIFGEGAGSEAYVPLPDGRSIPVTMRTPTFGGGAGMTQHNYNVTGGDIVVQGNADEKIIPQLRAEMAQSNKDMMAQLQRNIGTMSGKWGQRYGN